jgi:molybdopterin-containing oxidoreductase family iron-sulfur binding subunit
MSMDRRRFLKIAGLSTLLGLGGGAATAKMLWQVEPPGSQFEPSKDKLDAKQWAMVIDMKKFKSPEEYQKCINACHRVHNVPDFGNPKDEIKWLWTDDYEHTFPGQESEYQAAEIKEMPFLVLCNHCQEPPCVRVCPTKATFKSKDGITMMDYHRCIGCRFCMAACPYGARSFNYRDPRPHIKREIDMEYPTRTIGVVEKCTFCVERLNKGLRPACVEEAKESKALVFGDLMEPNSEVREVLSKHYTIRRKTELGTQPKVYYVIGGRESNV